LHLETYFSCATVDIAQRQLLPTTESAAAERELADHAAASLAPTDEQEVSRSFPRRAADPFRQPRLSDAIGLMPHADESL